MVNLVLLALIVIVMIMWFRGDDVPAWTMALVGIVGIVNLAEFFKGLYDRRHVPAGEMKNG